MSKKMCLSLNLTSALLLLLLINYATALRCYRCDSSYDRNCDQDDYTHLQFEDCRTNNNYGNNFGSVNPYNNQQQNYGGPYPKCYIYMYKSGNSMIKNRGCTYETDYCRSRSYGADRCSTCESDYCNSSSAVNAGLFCVIFGLFINYLVSK